MIPWIYLLHLGDFRRDRMLIQTDPRYIIIIPPQTISVPSEDVDTVMFYDDRE